MYTFEDRLNGDSLTLRPECTAGVVRSVVEHSLLYDGGKRLYYMGPMFRHERPQRGRYRQFDQIGAEALGFGGAEVDAELILLAVALWGELGLTDVRLEINSLGQPVERLQHRQALIVHLESHVDLLDDDARRRLHSNPLRILDTKNPVMQGVVDAAPRLLDFLGEASLAHFNALKAILDANGLNL
jgi:histidyl-tRNA synthetase